MKEKKDERKKRGKKDFFHQNDLIDQYRIERSPVITGDLIKTLKHLKYEIEIYILKAERFLTFDSEIRFQDCLSRSNRLEFGR